MESYSDLEINSSVELSETELEETPDLFLQPTPAATSEKLLFAVWEDPVLPDTNTEVSDFLGSSVGPVEPPLEVSFSDTWF